MVQKNNADLSGRARGRPRTYEPDVALQNAMGAFWKSGYSGTSLDAISEATGMNRPSLYAAFGDKQTLYLKSLAAYVEGGGAAIAAALDPTLPLRQGLQDAYRTALDLYCPPAGTPLGCLLVCTATAEAVNDADIRAALSVGMRSVDSVFETRLRHAQAQGELPPLADPVLLARVATSVLHSMALRSRAGDTREELSATVGLAITLLCGAER